MFEAKRKSIHFLGLSVPAVYYATSREVTILLVACAVLCAVLIEMARLKWPTVNDCVFALIGGYTREHEHTRITGATYFSVAALAAVVLFSQNVAVASLLFLTLGDSAAALVGTQVGHHKLHEKSVEGSLACFIVCSIVGYLFLGWIGVVGAAVATVAELAPVPADDNVRIPLVSGGVMQVIVLFG
jgi:dolichol kinase